MNSATASSPAVGGFDFIRSCGPHNATSSRACSIVLDSRSWFLAGPWPPENRTRRLERSRGGRKAVPRRLFCSCACLRRGSARVRNAVHAPPHRRAPHRRHPGQERTPFLGNNATPGTSTAINNATALGNNSTVSESDAVSLGDATANGGIGNPAPQSRLQIGNGATHTPGDYLQIPVLLATAKAPPAADCNNTTLVGRLVLLSGKKMSFFACSPSGVWVKVQRCRFALRVAHTAAAPVNERCACRRSANRPFSDGRSPLASLEPGSCDLEHRRPLVARRRQGQGAASATGTQRGVLHRAFHANRAMR
jgi:hypothetical protein